MDRSTAKRIIKSKPAFTPLILNKALLAFISFFMGRVVIFQSLNPIVPAFMGCMCFSGANFYISVLFSFIGLLTKSDINCFIKYMIFMAVMLIINIAVPTSKREKGLTFKSAASAIIILISALIFAAINSFSLYYTILAVLESILTFSIAMVLDKGVNIISKKNLLIASMPDREDIISISLIAGSVIAGASDLSLSGISVSIMLCSAISIIITYVYGGSAGAAASAMITLIMAVSSYCPFELMCIFSCAAIFSSVNKNLKKIFFAAVYSFICLILTIYLKKSLLISENIYAFLTAVLIFMLVPVKKLENMTKAPTNADEYISELKAVTINRLDNFSSSFAKLSKTLSDLSKKRTIAEKKEVSSIIDDVAAQLCIKCSMKNFCWENNFYSTYQTIFSILSVCEQKGFADEEK